MTMAKEQLPFNMERKAKSFYLVTHTEALVRVKRCSDKRSGSIERHIHLQIETSAVLFLSLKTSAAFLQYVYGKTLFIPINLLYS